MLSLIDPVPYRRVLSAAFLPATSLLLSLMGASPAVGQAGASGAAHSPAMDLHERDPRDAYDRVGQRALRGSAGEARDGRSGRSDAAAPGTAWRRHTIDDSSRGADGVRLKDVNGDGMPDLATGWEEGGIVRVYLNPGRSEVRRAWPAVTVGEVRSPEDAVLVDLDGDGSADVVSASEGAVRAIHLHHAPREPARYLDPGAWTTSAIPASQGRQWMFLLPMDVDGRNGTDLIVGSKGEGAMIGWLEAPSDPARTGEWRLHKLIDAGWMMSLISHDMDADGDLDVVSSDRYGAHAGVFWLENPGSEASRSGSPWRVHEIGAAGRQVMFVDVADLDGDGRVEVAAAVKPTDVLIMRQGEAPSTAWTTRTITLDPSRIGTAKAVAIADLTLDGSPEIAVSFEQAIGSKAGVVWTELPWREALDSGPIQDVSGPEGIKFDLMALLDLDGDGDLDIITCEESDLLGVVWYENPTR